jgi:dimethylaniline monooxygenase (N-oxide forming)
VKDACIVGAGSSGIVAAKVLADAGLAFDCFEKGSGIGGNWRYQNDNGMSAAYASLHINTSKRLMEYSDFPMPARYPDFPHHSDILRYFESYVEHNRLRDCIELGREVAAVVPCDGGYRVTAGGETREYRAVLVANGHHWDPAWPSFAGTFAGRTFHAHDYRTPESLAGKNVVIVGIGNSAADIACEVSHVAKRTILSSRRSAHVFPKYLFGFPSDRFVHPAFSRLPWRAQRAIGRSLLWIARGSQARYGLPEPEHGLDAAHPTISQELLHCVAERRVEVRPNVARLEGDRIAFTDGTVEPADVLIYATGYRISFPFFERDMIDVRDNAIRLYRRVVHPSRPHLYFVGLVQPLGAIMPLAELQARWIAGLLRREMRLPDRAEMEREIDGYLESLRARYVSSPRHTIQVDFHPYIRELRREMKRGRKRALA